MSEKPAPWAQAPETELKKIKGICLDIDDTLSTAGKLTAQAYQALWNLKNAGYFVVPITGRPAGWCDHFARFWPVDAIIGENGAFIFYMDHAKTPGVLRRLDTPGGVPGHRQKLAELGEKIRKRFPHAKWASDQSYREYDLAIDICEDVPHWSGSDVEALLELCHAEGARAKLSSIHVNTWFGAFDKRKGFENWMKNGYPGVAEAAARQGRALPLENEWLFIGDSPNDEPLFATFEFSVGVANLKKYLGSGGLKNPPRWITEGESGEGFAEMAARLVALKKPLPR